LVKQRMAGFGVAGRAAVVGTLVVVLGVLGVTGYALACSSLAAPTITSEPTNPTTSTSATFTYKDSTSSATFKCSLDSASFTTCANTGITYSSLAEGSHTFKVEAVSGSSTSSATSYTWAIVPPAPTITSEPTNPVASTSATFKFSDTLSGVSFKCSLDGASFTTCSSGISYSGLAQGSNTFEVEAVSGSATSSAASYTWQVDTTPPTITLTFPVAKGVYSSSTWAKGCSTTGICGTAADPSGVKSVAVGILQASSGKYWNGSSFSSSSLVLNTATGTTSWDYPLAVPPTGTYTLYVGATDDLGNTTPSSQYLTATFFIGVPSPNAIAEYSGSPQSATVGTAFGSALVAKVTDQYGNPFSGASVTFTAPSSGASGTFASPCSGTTCVVSTNSSGLATSPKFTANTVAGPYNVTGSVTGVSSTANFSLTNNPGCAKKLAFITSPVTGPVSSSATLGPITVQLEDAYGNPVMATGSGVVVKLTSSSTGGIFAGTSGGSHITSITITSGKTSATFYYGDTVTGTPTITASSCGLTSATQTETITGAATKLVFITNPVTGAASNSAELGPITVQVQNASGSPVNVAVNTIINLSSNSAGTYILNTSPGATSPTGATSVTILAGSSSVTFYYGDTKAGTPTITAASPPLTSATQTETITAATPKTISIVGGTSQSTIVNTNFGSALVVQVYDVYGNPVPNVSVSFSAPGTGASGIFTNSSNTISSPTGSNGQASSGTVTANTIAGGPYNVSAATAGPSPVNFALTNLPGPATKLVFTTQPSSGQKVTAGAVTSFKVSVEDTYGNVETSDNSTTVTLAIGANPGGSTLTCTNTNGLGPVTVASGVASFTCSLNKVGTGYTLTATSNPAHGTATSNAFNIVAGTANTITMVSGSPQSATQGSAFGSPLVALVTDTYGNPVSGASVTFAGPSSGASGTFAGCSGGNPHTYSCVVTTGANGEATSSTFTANNTGGQYTVTASTPGVSTPADFTLLDGENFTINGSISTPLYPGTGQPVDLSITNPNPEPITVTAGSVSVVISLGPGASTTAIAGCSPTVNFAMTQGLTVPVTIGAGVTESLSDRSVPTSDWPVISMIETHVNQDACEGAPLSFTWGATGSGS
jgi:hypothetical protein